MSNKIIIAVIAILGAHAIRLEPEVHSIVIDKKEGVGALLDTEQAKKAEEVRNLGGSVKLVQV